MPDRALVNSLSRYSLRLPFRYRLPAHGIHRAQGGWTRNLGARGAWVELPEHVAVPTGLEVCFDARGGDVRLAARVIWSGPAAQDRPSLHGLHFMTVAPEQRQGLCALLACQKACQVGRLYCALAATWRTEATGYAAQPCETRDLSSGGVALRVLERIPAGTRIHVTIPTAFGPVAADAQVIWAEPADSRPRGASYRHGLRFVSLNASSELPLRLLLAGWQ